MNEPLSKLLHRLEQGEILSGTYRRRALQQGQSIQFAGLVAWTASGTEYSTLDPAESSLFFESVNYRGSGTNSGFHDTHGDYFYESIGKWYSQKCEPRKQK